MSVFVFPGICTWLDAVLSIAIIFSALSRFIIFALADASQPNASDSVVVLNLKLIGEFLDVLCMNDGHLLNVDAPVITSDFELPDAAQSRYFRLVPLKQPLPL